MESWRMMATSGRFGWIFASSCAEDLEGDELGDGGEDGVAPDVLSSREMSSEAMVAAIVDSGGTGRSTGGVDGGEGSDDGWDEGGGDVDGFSAGRGDGGGTGEEMASFGEPKCDAEASGLAKVVEDDGSPWLSRTGLMGVGSAVAGWGLERDGVGGGWGVGNGFGGDEIEDPASISVDGKASMGSVEGRVGLRSR